MENLEWYKIISLILGSGVISSFITSFITKIQNDKNIKVEIITKEREKWRNKIRDLTKLVNDKFYTEKYIEINLIISDFETRLNPKDKEDIEIINILYHLSDLTSKDVNKIKEFNKRISLLLKYDWERVKREIKFWKLPWNKIPKNDYKFSKEES